MSALPGGDERPDLDLDQPDAGDAQVRALFRDGLRLTGAPPLDLGRIERQARRRHRRHQAVASGVVSLTAALAAVAVVVSPWSSGGGGQGVPAGPTPSVTRTALPEVTRASLLRTGDLRSAAEVLATAMPGELATDGGAQDLSGKELVDGVCVDNTLASVAPKTAWQQHWSPTGFLPNPYGVTQRVAQWPGQPDQASTALADLRAQLSDCTSGPGLEGLSVTTVHDESANVPTLFTSAIEGNGSAFAQGWMVWDDALVSIELGVPKDVDEETAHQAALTLLQLSSFRLTGQSPGALADAPLQVAAPAAADSARNETDRVLLTPTRKSLLTVEDMPVAEVRGTGDHRPTDRSGRKVEMGVCTGDDEGGDTARDVAAPDVSWFKTWFDREIANGSPGATQIVHSWKAGPESARGLLAELAAEVPGCEPYLDSTTRFLAITGSPERGSQVVPAFFVVGTDWTGNNRAAGFARLGNTVVVVRSVIPGDGAQDEENGDNVRQLMDAALRRVSGGASDPADAPKWQYVSPLQAPGGADE